MGTFSDEIRVAKELIRAGKLMKARKILKDVLIKNPKNEQAWFLIIHTYDNENTKKKIAEEGLNHIPGSKILKGYLEKKDEPVYPTPPKKQDLGQEHNYLENIIPDFSSNIEKTLVIIVGGLISLVGLLLLIPRLQTSQSPPTITPLSELPPTWTPDLSENVPTQFPTQKSSSSTNSCMEGIAFQSMANQTRKNVFPDLDVDVDFGYDSRLSEFDRAWILTKSHGVYAMVYDENYQGCITRMGAFGIIADIEHSDSSDTMGFMLGTMYGAFDETGEGERFIQRAIDRCADQNVEDAITDNKGHIWYFSCGLDYEDEILTYDLTAMYQE